MQTVSCENPCLEFEVEDFRSLKPFEKAFGLDP